MENHQRSLLTTKDLPAITGMSESYFEKGRIQGYGPPFIKFTEGKRCGKVLYRRSAVEAWLESQQCDPAEPDYV